MIKIKHLAVTLRPDTNLNLAVSDFNRLRWLVAALETNKSLRNSFSRNSTTHVTDSILLGSTTSAIEVGSNVILWDGYKSYQELLLARPDLTCRNDLIFLYVGSFKEVREALPAGAGLLFPRPGEVDCQSVYATNAFRLTSWLKTRTRSLRNSLYDHNRHRILATRKNIVFCGLLRPSLAVINNFLSGTSLEKLAPVLSRLSNVEWKDSYEQVRLVVADVYECCREANSTQPENMLCLYSILNVCHRLLVLSQLISLRQDIFVSEFELQTHLDPYDSMSYRQNTFLDFGSSRGSGIWYPRTMDMRATHKTFVTLRFLTDSDSLHSYIENTDSQAFIARRMIEVSELMEKY